MAIDAKDLGALEKALNDAAGKASVLWTTFVTFELYLAIAFGSVRHRDLFLETPIKLPILNVDLPLVVFFVVAPAILVIFYFYAFLQLYGLATKAREYNDLLKEQVRATTDRQYLRQRLDPFLVLQFFAGPREQRSHFQGLSLRLIAWITLVAAPTLILLQAQVTFLAYHEVWVTWFQRGLLLITLAIIWFFWDRVRSQDDPILGRVMSKVWPVIGATMSLCVFLFSAWVATFPGEWAHKHLAAVRLVPRTDKLPWSKVWPIMQGEIELQHWSEIFPLRWAEQEDWTSLHELLFAGAVDEVSGKPRSLFSNRLVLTDQTLVDTEKLEKLEVSRSFRGRDLRGAVLNRADLRQADFTGAILNESKLVGAKLEKARFGCASRGDNSAERSGSSTGWVLDRQPDYGCTSLQGASLNGAQLQGASLNRAQLQGASFDHAQLQGARLRNASVWRAHGKPILDLTSLGDLNCTQPPWGQMSDGTEPTFEGWLDKILTTIPEGARRSRARQRLSVLGPDEPTNPIWNTAWCPRPQDPDAKRLTEYLVTLACSAATAPYIARGLISSKRIEAPGVEITVIADRLRGGKADPTTCPGVKGFSEGYWEELDRIVERVRKATVKASAPSER